MKSAWLVVAVAACQSPVQKTVEQAVIHQCPTQTLEGIDVFTGDGAIDWAMVKSSGRDFAFIKATQGDYNRQTSFATNWSGAKAAGLARSAYHFFDATIDGVTQAQAFLAEIQANGGIAADDLPPMLDLECPTSSNQATAQANCEHSGDSGWAPSGTISQRAFDWLDTVQQATGKKAFIYSYTSWFAATGVTDQRLAEYPLFIASYNPTCASVPDPWTSTVFWQYSATGTVAGIAQPADVDRFIGSAGDLAALTGSAAAGDAGVVDSGSASGDAGNPETGNAAGCGCRAGGVATLVWLMVAAPVVMRRRRARPRRATRSR